MKAEIGGSAKIENDQNENPTTFCNNSNCFFQQSVAASVSQAQVYIFGQKFQQSRFCDVRWETQPQSLSFGRRTNDLVGSQGGWGNFWGRGKLLMIPLLAFGWESALEKKSSLWSRWKLIFIDALPYWVHCAGGLFTIFLSFVNKSIFAIETTMDFVFKSMNRSLCWKNTAPCKLAAIQSLFWGVGGGLGMDDGKENLVFMKGVLCHPLCSCDSAQSNNNWLSPHGDWRWIHLDRSGSDTCV